MRLPSFILPVVIATVTLGAVACGWFGGKDTRANVRASLAQRAPETAPPLSFVLRFNWAAVQQAREKATAADKQFANDAYNYVTSYYGSMGDPEAMDTLFLSLQRYPSAEIYLLLGFQNKTIPEADLNYQWFKQFGQDWWEKSKAVHAADSVAFYKQYGEDGTAIEYFEMAGRLGLSEGWYQSAAIYAAQGEASMAAARLNTAIDSGFADVPRFLNDTTFGVMRNLPVGMEVTQKMQAKFGELSTFYQKLRTAMPALSLPLALDSTLTKGPVFEEKYEAFVPEVTTEAELKLFGAMERFGPPTYHYVGIVSDPNRAYDLLIFEAESEDMGTSRYLHFATYDKQGHRLSYHPVMLASNYREADYSYGWSVVKVDNNMVISVETHQFEPENFDSENPPMRESIEKLKISIGKEGKLIAEKTEGA